MRLARASALQGGLFCLATLAALAVAAVAGLPDAGQELLFCALLILVLGVPHGALDVRYGQRAFGLSGVPAWSAFALAYVALAAVVVVIWHFFPLASLVVFLIVSAQHFAGDPVEGTDRATRWLAGGSVVILPALFHGPEMAGYFAVLAGPPTAVIDLVDLLHCLAVIWLPACLIATALAVRRGQLQTALELGCATALLVLLPPLTAFSLYFCLMHGARHILRTLAEQEPERLATIYALSASAMFGVLVLAAGAWWLMADALLEERVIRVVFIGLAALTLPHLVLVGPWLTDWQASRLASVTDAINEPCVQSAAPR